LFLTFAAKAQQKPSAAAKAPQANTELPLPTAGFYQLFVLPHNDTPAPAGYGLTPEQPIPVGAYAESMTDQQKISAVLIRFFKTFLWDDGTPIVFVSRKTEMINNSNIEKFGVKKENGKDTIILYVDLYKSAPVQAPKGFKFFTRENLAASAAPILTEIKAFDASPDKYNDEGQKESFQLLNYLQSNMNMSYLMDKAAMSPLMNDTGIDLDLRAFLIRMFIIHKFEYEATGHTDSSKDAFNTVVDDYKGVIALHTIAMQGDLANTMVKK
jgi:hypothetical protein